MALAHVNRVSLKRFSYLNKPCPDHQACIELKREIVENHIRGGMVMGTEDEIKKLAYKLWEEEGQPEGRDVEHYFRAKQILKAQESRNLPPLVGAPPPVEEIATAPPPLSKISGRKSRPRAR